MSANDLKVKCVLDGKSMEFTYESDEASTPSLILLVRVEYNTRTDEYTVNIGGYTRLHEDDVDALRLLLYRAKEMARILNRGTGNNK